MEALKHSNLPGLPGPSVLPETELTSPVVRSHWPFVWRADAENAPFSTLIISSKAKWLSSLSLKQQGSKILKSSSKWGKEMEITWIYCLRKMCKCLQQRKNTETGCHVFFQRIYLFLTQSFVNCHVTSEPTFDLFSFKCLSSLIVN